ncbi:MAG: hypothetical protein H6702_17335 [Myxococcales bacterium]|nr:hypothetical protein [Myxococcales bacterium]
MEIIPSGRRAMGGPGARRRWPLAGPIPLALLALSACEGGRPAQPASPPLPSRLGAPLQEGQRCQVAEATGCAAGLARTCTGVARRGPVVAQTPAFNDCVLRSQRCLAQAAGPAGAEACRQAQVDCVRANFQADALACRTFHCTPCR